MTYTTIILPNVHNAHSGNFPVLGNLMLIADIMPNDSTDSTYYEIILPTYHVIEEIIISYTNEGIIR